MSPAFFCKTMEARCICKGMAARFRNAVGAKFCEAREAMPTEPRRPQGSQSGAQVRDKACWQIETSQGGGRLYFRRRPDPQTLKKRLKAAARMRRKTTRIPLEDEAPRANNEEVWR